MPNYCPNLNTLKHNIFSDKILITYNLKDGPGDHSWL